MGDFGRPAGAGIPGLLLAATLSLPAAAATDAVTTADHIVIEKARRTLSLYANGRRMARFFVALGSAPAGRKICQGDNRTPEGYYFVAGRKENSDFHRALRISYPSPEDRARAEMQGCDPGGDIMIHGLREDWGKDSALHRLRDWTRGCVAVTNEEIEKIWALVPDGALVEIRP